ncbi:asparagine synthase-related protein [Chloroflexota bacterium]
MRHVRHKQKRTRILRKAFTGLLPDSVLNRVKQSFASGAGSAKLTKLIDRRAKAREDSGYNRQTKSNILLKSEASHEMESSY